MKNDEIRQADRKALPKFILIMAIFMFIGGAAGYFSARYGLDRLADGIKSAGEFFGAYIAPWLILAIAVIMPIVCATIYMGAKRILDSWDGENEDDGDIIDRKLSVVSCSACFASYASRTFSISIRICLQALAGTTSYELRSSLSGFLEPLRDSGSSPSPKLSILSKPLVRVAKKSGMLDVMHDGK